jgi:DNA-3-methyladenine glycosylase
VTLPREFYNRPTLDVARDLIGKALVHVTPAGRASGLIVEVEAYIGESDPACHAAPGPTKRNALLYGKPGMAYVYLNYGMHYLVNAVTEALHSPAAVLIRALEPDDGVELMQKRRARGSGKPAASFERNGLCRGPGNLTKALGIALGQNGLDLTGGELFIAEPRVARTLPIAWGPRIGISVGTEQPWRCYVPGNPCVSGKPSMNGGGRITSLTRGRTRQLP